MSALKHVFKALSDVKSLIQVSSTRPSFSLQMKYPTGSSTALLPEVYGEKGWTYLKLYNLKAVDCFQQALELQPDDSEWNAGYAIALHRREMVSFLKHKVNMIQTIKPQCSLPVSEMFFFKAGR